MKRIIIDKSSDNKKVNQKIQVLCNISRILLMFSRAVLRHSAFHISVPLPKTHSDHIGLMLQLVNSTLIQNRVAAFKGQCIPHNLSTPQNSLSAQCLMLQFGNSTLIQNMVDVFKAQCIPPQPPPQLTQRKVFVVVEGTHNSGKLQVNNSSFLFQIYFVHSVISLTVISYLIKNTSKRYSSSHVIDVQHHQHPHIPATSRDCLELSSYIIFSSFTTYPLSLHTSLQIPSSHISGPSPCLFSTTLFW